MDNYSTQRGKAILEMTDTSKLSESVQSIIQDCSYFFLATASKDAKPNVNFKGGEKGFVHVLDDTTIIFPDIEGNGIFHGVNDIIENQNIGLLFIDFIRDIRYKVNGIATVIDDKESINKYLDLKGFDYAQRAIKVDITYVLGNCSRHIEKVRNDIMAFERDWELSCGS